MEKGIKEIVDQAIAEQRSPGSVFGAKGPAAGKTYAQKVKALRDAHMKAGKAGNQKMVKFCDKELSKLGDAMDRFETALKQSKPIPFFPR